MKIRTINVPLIDPNTAEIRSPAGSVFRIERHPADRYQRIARLNGRTIAHLALLDDTGGDLVYGGRVYNGPSFLYAWRKRGALYRCILATPAAEGVQNEDPGPAEADAEVSTAGSS